jgi:pyruvate carboxylase
VQAQGFAFQCRVTTEDPENKFTPDYGRITHYRSAGGLGIRLDGGTATTGAIVTPFYDSMLVKVSASGRRFIDAARRMERALQEFRIRGVKTNIPFLLNVIAHEEFLEGRCTTRFIDETPDLFRFPIRQDRASKLLTFAAEVTVNGFPGVVRPGGYEAPGDPEVPAFDRSKAAGRDAHEASARWARRPSRAGSASSSPAHHRHDVPRRAPIAPGHAGPDPRHAPGGRGVRARVPGDVLHRDVGGGHLRHLDAVPQGGPWDRLAQLREKIPNILFQMLLRGSNAVGYTSYPDNVVREFVKESAAAGIDLFRVFDALNWIPNMEVALESVREAGALCEAAICYTGDILDPKRTKYDLKYYVGMAKELENRGANLIAIKDMAGLCKPYAAERLIKALREEVGLPVHFHTHDIGGAQAASILKAAEVGLDVADGAVASMSALTSQPSLNAIVRGAAVHAARDRRRPPGPDRRQPVLEGARTLYAPFETGLRAPSAEVYAYEMPGGQYTNLLPAGQGARPGARWTEVCKAYLPRSTHVRRLRQGHRRPRRLSGRHGASSSCE